MTHYFGAHTIDNGGLHMAVRRAARARMSAMQLFTAVPKFYGDKSNMRQERVDNFRKAVADTRMDPRRIMAHGAYVLNTGTPDTDKWIRARDGLTKELERSSLLGLGQICYHPGAATDGNREAAAERIAGAIIHALETVKGDCRLLIENTAGAGSTMGRTAQEVGLIMAHIPKRHRARTGYGLDTCHLFASGYDIRTQDALTRTLDEFEEEAGEAPGFFHLNDSAGELGSNRDRHVLIGEGHIGVQPFQWLVGDRRSQGIPMILETPQQDYEIGDADDSPDPYDVRMMELLRRFAE